MANNLKFLALIFALSGLIIGPLTISEIFAEKGGNDKAKGDPQGCDNGKGKDISQNPNCKNSIKFTQCDVNSDGAIDSDELHDWIFAYNELLASQTEGIIVTAEKDSSKNDKNSVIDTNKELDIVNDWLSNFNIPICN